MMNLIRFVNATMDSNISKIGIFDAGSSGTRLKVFTFDGSLLKGEKVFKSDDIAIIPSKGIHEQSDDEIQSTILQILELSDISKNTVIGFYGTAGLRSVSIESQSRILSIVKKATLDYKLVENKIISGVEEALYSLKGYEFLKHTENYYTLIDMGGKSVQIIQRIDDQFKLASLDLGISHSDCKSSKSTNLLKSFFLDTHWKAPIKYDNNNEYTCHGRCLSLSQDQYNIQSIDFDYCNKKTHETKSLLYNFKRCLNNTCILNDMSKNEDQKNIFINFLKKLNRGATNINISFLKDNDRHNCIDEFFKKNLFFKLDENKSVLLMSYYEELISPTDIVNLGNLFERYETNCKNIDTITCAKLYYAISFLSLIGVEDHTDLKLINNIENLDISWALGKALELKDRFDEKMKYCADSEQNKHQNTHN